MNEKKEKTLKKLFAIVAITSMMILVGYQIIFSIFDINQKSTDPNINANNNSLEDNNQPTSTEEKTLTEEKLPEEKPIVEDIPSQEKIYLSVPFTSQSPYAEWDELHNEACEEASLIMVDAFLKNKILNTETADKEILAMVDWQMKIWNEHKDLTLEEIKEIAEKYLGYENVKIKNNITIEDIKSELKKGNPIIAPFAGRFLGNSYYRQPGPYYHMLVITGYENDKFITNDPGTRRGENYTYDQNTLFNALHDWPGKDIDISNGLKNILVINPIESPENNK